MAYFDANGDETLDVEREPIIGFTAQAGVLYAQNQIEQADGSVLSSGYHLYRNVQGCAEAQFLSQIMEDDTETSTPLIISGTTSLPFRQFAGCWMRWLP